jgi:hypothetical protein
LHEFRFVKFVQFVAFWCFIATQPLRDSKTPFPCFFSKEYFGRWPQRQLPWERRRLAGSEQEKSKVCGFRKPLPAGRLMLHAFCGRGAKRRL